MVRSLPPQHVLPSWTQRVPIDTGEISSHILRVGLANWHGVCFGRQFPARNDIKLRNIAGVLRNTAMIKVLDDGGDYECCVLGDTVARAYSVTLQGRKVSDVEGIAPPFGKVIRTLFDQVITTQSAIAMRRVAGRDFPEARLPNAEILLLPLGADGTSVDHILAFVSFCSDPL